MDNLNQDPYLFGEKEVVFDALSRKCKIATGKINNHLKYRMHYMQTDERSEIVNRRDFSGFSLLFLACAHGNYEMCSCLIYYNADLEQRGPFYDRVTTSEIMSCHEVTPLWFAAMCKNVQIIQLLIDHGANVNARVNHCLPSIQTILNDPELSSALKKNKLFNEIIVECCKESDHDENLPRALRRRLENYSAIEMKEIVSRTYLGCAPLFNACLYKRYRISRYLIQTCGAEVDQLGMIKFTENFKLLNKYDDPADVDVAVTPLWLIAPFAEKVPSILRLLVRRGADVNFMCNYDGSTPVLNVNNTDIMIYLVERGANILKSSFDGRSLLMNDALDCEFLLYLATHGADGIINSLDWKNNSALSRYINSDNFELETMELFIYYDAILNADDMKKASLRGHETVLNYVRDLIFGMRPEIKPLMHAVVDAIELMGSTKLIEYCFEGAVTSLNEAKSYFKRAIQYRRLHLLYPKIYKEENLLPEIENAAQLFFKDSTECEDIAEVESMHLTGLRMQSLLVNYRILGPCEDFFERCFVHLILDKANNNYQNVIDIWIFIIQIYAIRDEVLDDSSYTSSGLVRYFLDLHHKKITSRIFSYNLRFEDLIRCTEIFVNGLSKWKELLSIMPVAAFQQIRFDDILMCISHLLYLLIEYCTTNEEAQQIKKLSRKAVHINPRCSFGNTLLHLACARDNIIRDVETYFGMENIPPFDVMPNYNVVKLLIESGAAIDDVNNFNSTPLHYASSSENFNLQIVQILLDYGGHIDQVNKYGLIPYQQILKENAFNANTKICGFNYMSLKCLAAKAIRNFNIPYDQLPNDLKIFINTHKR